MKDCKEDAIGRMIYFTGQEMRNFAEKVLKPFDLTLEQFHLLKEMPADSALTQREVGEIAQKKPANMTRILDRLESKALIERRGNPDDRRASLVVITVKGAQLIDQVIGGFEDFSNKLVEGISEEEQEVVRRSLQKISVNVKNLSETINN